ncbi:hypothetical protein BJ165DRAFT_192773 [Panaeolus papilionaceus]|nr:hypothetical protein BJ165DRAFT_192773 [Panaeolus papilionaceus]
MLHTPLALASILASIWGDQLAIVCTMYVAIDPYSYYNSYCKNPTASSGHRCKGAEAPKLLRRLPLFGLEDVGACLCVHAPLVNLSLAHIVLIVLVVILPIYHLVVLITCMI